MKGEGIMRALLIAIGLFVVLATPGQSWAGETPDDVAVLTRDMKQGEIVAAGDVTLKPRAETRATRDALSDADAATGFAVRRAMRAGQPLRAADLRTPAVIAKGEIITLVYQAPGLSLSVSARALAEGTTGDTIAVVNTQSHRNLEARVVAPGVAIVAPRPDSPLAAIQ